MKSAFVLGFTSALMFGGAAIAADVPTGYLVEGCKDYRLDENNRVVQLCKVDGERFFNEIMVARSGVGTGDAGDGDGDGEGGDAE